MARKWMLTLLLAAAALVRRVLFAAGVKIGDPAPSFEGIVGTDDQKHNLADFKDAKFVVLVFTCNHRPVAKDYEGRLDRHRRRLQGQRGAGRGRQRQ